MGNGKQDDRSSGSKRNVHGVINPKHFVAVGAFPQPRSHSLLNAFPAKHVSAGLDGRVLEIQSADRADSQSLIAKR